MKSQRNIFKWAGMAFLLAVFMLFTFLLPSVSAQEETPPASTETPTEVSPEETYFSTMPRLTNIPTSGRLISPGRIRAARSC